MQIIVFTHRYVILAEPVVTFDTLVGVSVAKKVFAFLTFAYY